MKSKFELYFQQTARNFEGLFDSILQDQAQRVQEAA